MMEKEHLIHHIWSLRGYELYMLILLTQTNFNFYCLAEEEQTEFNSGSHIICNSSQIPATQLLLLGGCQRQKTQLDIQNPDWVLLCWQLRQTSFWFVSKQSQSEWKVIKRKHILYNIHCAVAFPTFPILTFFLNKTLSSLVDCFNDNFWSYWSQWPIPTDFDGTRRWLWGKTSKILRHQFYHLCGRMGLI